MIMQKRVRQNFETFAIVSQCNMCKKAQNQLKKGVAHSVTHSKYLSMGVLGKNAQTQEKKGAVQSIATIWQCELCQALDLSSGAGYAAPLCRLVSETPGRLMQRSLELLHCHRFQRSSEGWCTLVSVSLNCLGMRFVVTQGSGTDLGDG